MSKFKVGDKVRRVVKFDGPYGATFIKNRVYTVTAVGPSSRWIDVDVPKPKWAGHGVLPFDVAYFEAAPYSSYFTEPSTVDGIHAGTTPVGHIKGSPIQKHSKGEFYPLCVVCYTDKHYGGRKAFTIENLETGKVLAFVPGEFKGGPNVRAWLSAQHAYAFLADYSDRLAKSEWVEGRPVFQKNGYGLIIEQPTFPNRKEVHLQKVDLTGDTFLLKGVYYKALDQDIG